ncbi:centrosomal protein of 131 kda-like [Plakobranchus ocellatus]|uniref:Centrosomal protein of 131 kDa-like n=1 Tax=Plakobranchus ocellatus TaxID=259542 RepID=A0AAV4A0I5_9GAST|nr:centrosomal protein of 131 kda-like [Plakobranchus ocellatus]
MAQRRQDELNLSLTGSQISAISARSVPSRPGSAKKANSMVETQTNKASLRDKKIPNRRGSINGESSPPNQMSIVSAPVMPLTKKHSTGGAVKSMVEESEDFLALFENSVQPKIKGRSSSSNSFGKKQSPAKVSSGDLKMKSSTKKPAWASKPSSANSTARSENPEPHNIFRPVSALSTDDEWENENLRGGKVGEYLAQSISKLHSLENTLSDMGQPRIARAEKMSLPNSNRSTATRESGGSPQVSLRTQSIEDFIQDIMDRTPRNVEDTDMASVNSPSSSFHRTDSRTGSAPETIAVANNMFRPSEKSKAKAHLLTMENSYQNIKHKSPVNQVRKSSSGNSKVTGNNSTGVHSRRPTQARKVTANTKELSTGHSSVEQYMDVLASAAIKIQKWYRRHRTRRMAAEAAVKRLLSQKKEEHEQIVQSELAQSMNAGELEIKTAAERKKAREDKAKEARQQAIQELQKKREERKNEVKKVAEEEVKFLQASGKVTKNPSFGSKKNKPSNGTSSSVISKRLPVSMGKEILAHSPEHSARESKDSQAPQGSQRASDKGQEDAELTVTGTDKATEANTRTTLEDLYSTLKKLEEEENFLSARTEKKHSWLDDLDKVEDEPGSNLTAENLQKLNSSKEALSKSGFLTGDKLKSIINFLDEVQVTDRLSEIDTEISRMNEGLMAQATTAAAGGNAPEIPLSAPLVPSADEVAQIEQAQVTASEVTNAMLSQRLELDEKQRTVSMLQKALNQQRELTIRHARETEKEMKKRLDVQKEEYEEAIKRHLSFIDQLIDDKKNLSEKCEKVVTELKVVDKKYQEKIKAIEESHSIEMSKLKEVHAAAEKLRREKWIEDKTKKIKEMTVKGLEPEIQRLIAKHKSDMNKVKQIHEAELLESDERAAQKYVKMTEELRDQLAAEKEAACAREREMSKQRYEKQLQQEEEAFQQQRRRLYQEVQEEKDRVATSASRQRSELEKLQQQLEDSHRHALQAMKEQFDKARDEQDRRHKSEISDLKEKLKLEKESWEENYMKRHETWLVQKERELRDKIKKERDKEIELVIERLEEDASTVREDNERSTEQKIRRMREKFEMETKELEQSERKAVQKHNEIKAKMTEVEGENERLKVIIKQKEQEIFDTKKLLEKMNSERSHVSDIVRQEFADRIVATDEESKRTKHEISELRARHRLELEKAQNDMEELRKAKDEEMEEVHRRVKQAIVKKEEVVAQLKQQYQAANKRADHLEGLLEQQRKQLLTKK